jgi:hypothetical protein
MKYLFPFPGLSRIVFPLWCGLLLSLVMLHNRCTKDTPETPFFPATYQYDGFEFSPSRFYVLTASGYKEIPATGSFIEHDQVLKQEADFENTVVDGFPAQKMEVLDDTKVRISGTLEGPGTDPYSFEGTYTRKGNRFTIHIGQDSLVYLLESDASKAFWELSTTLFSYKENGKTVYSPFELTAGISPSSSDSLIQTLRTQYKLMPNDTLAINHSRHRYLKQ